MPDAARVPRSPPRTVYPRLANSIAPPVLRSGFLAQGGYAVLQDFWDPRVHDAIAREAAVQYALASEHVIDRESSAQARGGDPARAFLSSPGGNTLQWAYGAVETAEALREYTGLAFTPTGASGTFTYYCRAGDYLGLHRDVVGCDLALITCIENTHWNRRHGGNNLWLYPERWQEPLSAIRRNPESGAVPLTLAPRQTLLFLGGLIPHFIDACLPGQTRVVAILCFRAI